MNVAILAAALIRVFEGVRLTAYQGRNTDTISTIAPSAEISHPVGDRSAAMVEEHRMARASA